MADIALIIFIHAFILSFAFGLAWFIPLLKLEEIQHQREIKKINLLEGYLDLLLIMFDCVPFFWIFRAAPKIPGTYKSAREAWKTQKSIRINFYLSLHFTICTIVFGFLTFSLS